MSNSQKTLINFYYNINKKVREQEANIVRREISDSHLLKNKEKKNKITTSRNKSRMRSNSSIKKSIDRKMNYIENRRAWVSPGYKMPSRCFSPDDEIYGESSPEEQMESGQKYKEYYQRERTINYN